MGQQSSRRITALCSLLGYSRQAFYQHHKQRIKLALQHDLIIQRVLSIRTRQPQVGTRKLHIMLNDFMALHNMHLGRDALQELLREEGLLIRRRRRKVPRTTFSDHWMHKYANLTIGLEPLKAHELWVSDITYVAVGQGFAYLSLVTDVYSRMIVGYHLDAGLSAQACVKALRMAMRHLPEKFSLIHHSDRGCQYCSAEYVQQLQSRSIAISMTQHSDPRENAIAERVNGILKGELLKKQYSTLAQGRSGIKEAIQIYNWERLHGSVDMLTPGQAVQKTTVLNRWWKNYYKRKPKEANMQTG